MLKHPFTAIVSGATTTGKTSLIGNILRYKEEIIEKTPQKIFLFYSVHQPIYDSWLQNGLITRMFEGLPPNEELKELISRYKNEGSMCIFDDAIHDIKDNIAIFFTTYAHHYSSSMIFVTQNLFLNNSYYRTMSQNAQYVFIMKGPRSANQVNYFGNQVLFQKGHLVRSFEKATRNNYSYLLIDFKVTTPDHLRIRSNIFPNDGPMVVYLQNKTNYV